MPSTRRSRTRLSAAASSFDDTAAHHAISPAIATFHPVHRRPSGRSVGAFSMNRGAGRAFVHEFWVAPAVRHLRGGELLVNAARSGLRTKARTEIYAWVADENRNAMRFYERSASARPAIAGRCRRMSKCGKRCSCATCHNEEQDAPDTA